MEVSGNSFYKSTEGQENALILTRASIELNDQMVKKYGGGNCGLIMGYGEGLMVDHFKNIFKQLIVVEGSEQLCQYARDRHTMDKNVEIVQAFFEDYATDKQIDAILANHVLEHVTDPVEILNRCKEWLSPSGYGIFTSPNATSLHRRIGVEMGIIPDIYAKTANDKKVGHKRVYDRNKFEKDAKAAGLTIKESGGYNLKLVSQKQMADWPENLLEAIFKVSLSCPPEICSNLFLVCSL